MKQKFFTILPIINNMNKIRPNQDKDNNKKVNIIITSKLGNKMLIKTGMIYYLCVDAMFKKSGVGFNSLCHTILMLYRNKANFQNYRNSFIHSKLITK